MDVQVDEHGRVRGFAYHDGTLDGLRVDSSGTAVALYLRALTGEAWVVGLGGVTWFLADQFRLGNIVLDLWWRPLREALASTTHGDVLVQRLGDDVGRLPGDAMLFLLECSYGAEVTAVCASIELAPRDRDSTATSAGR